MNEYFQIAIDGPVASGKSSVARELSRRARFVYVDTGAMYRAVTLFALRSGVSVLDKERLVGLVRSLDIDVRMPEGEENDGRLSTVMVGDEDVSWEIRNPEVSSVVAKVASLPRVREVLVPKQRKIALEHDVVMEGRDITYVVLPDADLKIFLTAREDVRIERYYKMMAKESGGLTEEEAAELLKKRDELDTTREASPLRIVAGAWVLDTSDLTVSQVVDTIIEKVKEKRGEKRKGK